MLYMRCKTFFQHRHALLATSFTKTYATACQNKMKRMTWKPASNQFNIGKKSFQQHNAQISSHVVFLVSGLFGSPRDWEKMREVLQEMQDKEILVHVSQANQLHRTFDGIDVCGSRLADEMKEVISRHPNLKRISLVGHSMGGLMLRYAAAILYDPTSRKICALQPAHFISISTPHLGCLASRETQVPFIRWTGPFSSLLDYISAPTASLLFSRTGSQFFLADSASTTSSHSTTPLLFQMSEDNEETGLHFFSALESFKSRTAYANTGWDHLVSWANSSLRFRHELPKDIPQVDQEVLIIHDDISTAFQSTVSKPSTEEHQSYQQEKDQVSLSKGEDASPAEHSGMVHKILSRLQKLPWRRVDVVFQDSPILAITAHNHIQARYHWISGGGVKVAQHLAEQLLLLDEYQAGVEKQQPT